MNESVSELRSNKALLEDLSTRDAIENLNEAIRAVNGSDVVVVEAGEGIHGIESVISQPELVTAFSSILCAITVQSFITTE